MQRQRQIKLPRNGWDGRDGLLGQFNKPDVLDTAHGVQSNCKDTSLRLHRSKHRYTHHHKFFLSCLLQGRTMVQASYPKKRELDSYYVINLWYERRLTLAIPALRVVGSDVSSSSRPNTSGEVGTDPIETLADIQPPFDDLGANEDNYFD
jgi:hypothetical protein